MSLVPSREDQAFGAGYSQASEAGGMVINHLARRLREVEVQRDELVKALEEAKAVIRGVVTSYPVAAGTSKYGYEADHDGYGSIRECRLYLERSGDPVGGSR